MRTNDSSIDIRIPAGLARFLEKHVDEILAEKRTRMSGITVAWKGREVRPYPDAVHVQWPEAHLERQR
jgi:hypothetical protein